MKLFPLALLLAACSTAAPTPSPSPVPTPSPSPLPSPTPAAVGLVATFQVGDEQYRVLLTDAEDVAIAQRLLSGDDTAPGIPNGLIVRGDASVNEGWSWSIDPDSLEFADMTTEVCDGLPSYVEDGSLTGDYFCPWSAEIIDLVQYPTP
ncbi:MAG TPA: hypothetical protein VM284_01065 [Candidatus Limnocylindria bacterium]|nr:hypothetical protein [Candidatus Limnocylindria bacterium]